MFPVQLTVGYWNRSHAMEDQIVIIGERLGGLREEKKFHNARSKSERGFSVVTSLVSKTDTLCQPSQH